MTKAIEWLDAHGGIVLAGLALFYAVLGLLVLNPQVFYSGDIGVMYVQAMALADHRFTSLDIPYPAEFLDPGREFFPMRPPFVMATGGSTQAIFSPASAVLQAVAVAVAGLPGLVLLSIAGGAVTLYAARKLSPAPYGTAVAIALGLGTPLWFHAIAGWEHAPGVACGTAAFACAVRSRGRAAPLVAGLLVGMGAILRDEVVLLMPGVLIALWWSRRDARALAAAVAGVLIPLALAASMEVWWFQRPVAAHLRHAVHLVQSAMHVTDAPNPDVPSLQAFTLRERYDTVVVYWLLGYGTDRVVAAFAAGLAVALLIRLRWQSSLGLLLWLTVILVFAAADVWELVTAPKWLAGLHRVSPFLVFALFPLPAGVPEALVRLKPDATDTEASVASGFSRTETSVASGFSRTEGARESWLRPAILLTAAAYLVVAFAGVDTAGGKGLGPRLLLPLFPLLTVSAIVAIGAYLASAAAADRWVGRAGLVLAGMAVAIHLFGAIPAYCIGIKTTRG